jgi:hypothetical protein
VVWILTNAETSHTTSTTTAMIPSYQIYMQMLANSKYARECYMSQRSSTTDQKKQSSVMVRIDDVTAISPLLKEGEQISVQNIHRPLSIPRVNDTRDVDFACT